MNATNSRLPTIRINLGLMGHVDSGKTTLAKSLSAYASTAAFDKSPQSQERGITLDLGFSAFLLPLISSSNSEACLFTLVDCPGHASLIRTVLGAVGIIDMIILVIDVIKGVQTQTAESLVIADMATNHLMIVLTKTDLLDEETSADHISNMTQRIRKTISRTSFNDAPIIALSAIHGHVEEFYKTLTDYVQRHRLPPPRPTTGNALCQVDHCFSVRGQGTVFTGTLTRGNIKIGDSLEIGSLGIERKIKSLQIFKQPIEQAFAGDRIGLIFTPQVDANSFERGILYTPRSVPTSLACFARLHRIRYYRGPVISRQSLFHITIGHETCMGRLTLLSDVPEDQLENPNSSDIFSNDYLYESKCSHDEKIFHGALVEFDRPLRVPHDSLIVLSKLDSQLETSNQCRLALCGRVLRSLFKDNDLGWRDSFGHRTRMFRWKQKFGKIDRIIDPNRLLIRDMFSAPEKIQRFLNEQVALVEERTDPDEFNDLSTLEDGGSNNQAPILGIIESTFGQKGKLKVYFSKGHQIGEPNSRIRPQIVLLRYKKYILK